LTHLAPETIQESIKSKATDVFAYGIMLHEIMCPGQLYFNANRNFLRHAVTLGKRPEFPVWVPMSYQHLATSCWDRDPKLRPSFKDILRILLDLIAEEESKGTQQKRPTSMVMNEDVQGDGEKKQSGVASSAAAPPNICHSTFDFHGSGIFVGSMIEEKERYEDVLEKMLADRDILTKSIDETLR
jgi:serine/threonine protein kinase